MKEIIQPDAYLKKMGEDDDWTVLHWNKENQKLEFDSEEPLYSATKIKEEFNMLELINQLSIANRHMKKNNIDGESMKKNHEIQEKNQKFLVGLQE